MSKTSVRQTGRYTGQTDRLTERQNDSMADSRAAKEPALVLLEKQFSQGLVLIQTILFCGDLIKSAINCKLSTTTKTEKMLNIVFVNK